MRAAEINLAAPEREWSRVFRACAEPFLARVNERAQLLNGMLDGSYAVWRFEHCMRLDSDYRARRADIIQVLMASERVLTFTKSATEAQRHRTGKSARRTNLSLYFYFSVSLWLMLDQLKEI